MAQADPRKALEEGWLHLEEQDRDDLRAQMKAVWERCLNATKKQRVRQQIKCKYCVESFVVDMNVDVPDILTQVRALEILINQVQGKPQETKLIQYDIGEVTLDALSKMPTVELARYLGVDPSGIVDAEFHELEVGNGSYEHAAE